MESVGLIIGIGIGAAVVFGVACFGVLLTLVVKGFQDKKY
jgi:hypothetical protein